MRSDDKRITMVYSDALRLTVMLSDAVIARIDEQDRAEGRSRANMVRLLWGDLDAAVKASKPKQPAVHTDVEPQPVSDIINIIRPGVVVQPQPSNASTQPRTSTNPRSFQPILRPKDSKRR